MTSVVGPCEVCGRGVLATSAAHPVTGWEAARGGGGANRILDRERDDHRVAHATCIEQRAARRRAGIADSQLGLFQ